MTSGTTLVSTVFNEVLRIEQTIADLKSQTLQPSEIIITDAGSTDGTYEKLLEWKATSSVPIIILQEPKCNVAKGRNIAIRAANHNIIASTDFGCRFHPNWLESILSPFDDAAVNIVSGAYTVKEEDQVTLAAKAAYILSNGYISDVKDPWFIPSSRSIAYKKEVFDKVGGYCEWLTLAADDLVFGKEVLSKGYTFCPVDKPYVYWIRHSNAKGFIKEAGRYGLGDGEARVNTRNFLSNLILLIVRCCFVLSVPLCLVLCMEFSALFIFVFFLFLPGFRCYVSYTSNWWHYKSKKYNLSVYFFGFYMMEITKVNYLIGYIRGLLYASPLQQWQAKLLKKRLLST